jgi:hypothetical protein
MNDIERVTDKTLRAWLHAGPVDRGIGGGLTFPPPHRGHYEAKRHGSFATALAVARRRKYSAAIPTSRSKTLASWLARIGLAFSRVWM